LERSYDDVEEKGGAGWYDVTSAPVTVGQAGRYHCATQNHPLSPIVKPIGVGPPNAKLIKKLVLILLSSLSFAKHLLKKCTELRVMTDTVGRLS
jgi:hypothetical protein